MGSYYADVFFFNYMLFDGCTRGKKKRAAPVLNSRIVQIEASFICSLLEFSLRAFFFRGL